MIPGLGRAPGEGNGNPLQYSCLENSMDRGAWRATVCRAAKELDTTERLSHLSRPPDGGAEDSGSGPSDKLTYRITNN